MVAGSVGEAERAERAEQAGQAGQEEQAEGELLWKPQRWLRMQRTWREREGPKPAPKGN